MKKLLILVFGVFLLGASLDEARKANDAYTKGDYAKAVELYKEAIKDNPDNAKLYFNLGNALAKSGQPQQAIRYYEQFKSMTKDPDQKAMADYNIGNIYSESKKWDKALEHYKESLRYKAVDNDAKHNYELAKQKKEQQKKQQNKNKQQKQNNQNQDKNKQQQKQKQQDKQQQQNQQQNNNQQQQQQRQKPQEKISKAEAQKILKALGQKEKDLLKKFKKQKTSSSNNTNGKDW